MPKITVIIATYNRCNSLKNTLDSLLGQECDGSLDYEVIVVDNNSNDRTKDVVESYTSKLNGKIRYLFEVKQGKSYALNKGIKESSGEIIAFTDDDCIADKKWLLNIFECFREYNCDGVGGRIEPIWLKDKPSWLVKGLYGKLAILDYGNDAFEAKSLKHQFYGANFAFKKELFKRNGLFKEKLGPKGKKLFPGEDTDIFSRFLDYGAKLIYYPYAIVFHKIPGDRLKKSYFIKWHFSTGQSKAHTISTTGRKFLGTPFWVWKEFLNFLFKKSRIWVFTDQLRIFQYFGFFYAKMTTKPKLCR